MIEAFLEKPSGKNGSTLSFSLSSQSRSLRPVRCFLSANSLLLRFPLELSFLGLFRLGLRLFRTRLSMFAHLYLLSIPKIYLNTSSML